jgi:hypothetical protein
MIVLADYWRRGGQAPSELSGTHQIGMRFHFEPSVWKTGDEELWMGKVDTPPITVEFPAAR